MVEPDIHPSIQGKRRIAADFIEGKKAITFITALILINAVTLGLETEAAIMAQYGYIITLIDQIILGVFVIELAIKFYAYRLSFFKSGWNTFDFIIIGIALIPASGSLSILRALRILRVLRLLSVVPQMRRVITAIGYSIPGMMSVISVLLLIFYVSAVLATKLFGTGDDPQMQEWFGSIGASGYTLFQIMTLESWSMGIVRPTMEIYPWAWIFFIPFIIITSFAVLNLFIGIIVDAMQMAQKEPRKKDREEIKEFTHEEIMQLHARFDDLQKQIETLNAKN
ncbi:MAG: ion transporter [Pseudomonadota bacterium]